MVSLFSVVCRSTKAFKPYRFILTTKTIKKSKFSDFGSVLLPSVKNEPDLHYAPGSPERKLLKEALAKIRSQCPEIPCIVNGKEIYTGNISTQIIPSDHTHELCKFHCADESTIKLAINSALDTKPKWESLPMEDRLAIFTKASWLLSNIYRYDLIAATMLGTGKNVWQGEIDAGMELIDFWRFGAKFVQELYDSQKLENSNGVWNRLEYRPLEGFCLAISPFNFCAIAGNLCSTPAMVANTVVWKPSSTAILSNYMVYQILVESGLPPGVINFIPSSGSLISKYAVSDPNLSSLNFTGSTAVFQEIWKSVGQNIAEYKTYPRIIGETGGKNFHMIHNSCDIETVVNASIRGAFEYQGQKCSALSRMYCPKSIWGQLKSRLIEETQKIKIGQPEEFDVFMSAVIDAKSFANIKKYVDGAIDDVESSVLVGGHFDDSRGYFVSPTIIETRNPYSPMMSEEIFGPVLSCYVYEDEEYEQVLDLCNATSVYALTGAIFAQDRNALAVGTRKLRQAAGNFYVNDKCTGAVVGQQPFGGARSSGTNDKAGFSSIFYRFASIRAIKETFLPQRTWSYPSMNKE